MFCSVHWYSYGCHKDTHTHAYVCVCVCVCVCNVRVRVRRHTQTSLLFNRCTYKCIFMCTHNSKGILNIMVLLFLDCSVCVSYLCAQVSYYPNYPRARPPLPVVSGVWPSKLASIMPIYQRLASNSMLERCTRGGGYSECK